VGSSAQLAEKILELKRSPALRESLGAAGRQNALENYDFAVTVKCYTHLYQAAVKSLSL
jgi:glycosyltransferase involved in cell wall biosynthesis